MGKSKKKKAVRFTSKNEAAKSEESQIEDCEAAMAKLCEKQPLNNNTTCQSSYSSGCDTCQSKPMSIFGYYAELVDFKEYLAISVLLPSVVCHVYEVGCSISEKFHTEMDLLAKKYKDVKFCKVEAEMATALAMSLDITDLPAIIVSKNKKLKCVVNGCDAISANVKICIDILEMHLLYDDLIESHGTNMPKQLIQTLVNFSLERKMKNTDTKMTPQDLECVEELIDANLKSCQNSFDMGNVIGVLTNFMALESETNYEIKNIEELNQSKHGERTMRRKTV